jgi:hypothetical protein
VRAVEVGSASDCMPSRPRAPLSVFSYCLQRAVAAGRRRWGIHTYNAKGLLMFLSTLARRQTFFHDIQALMRYMVFDSWEHLMAFMLRGLELESQVNTS